MSDKLKIGRVVGHAIEVRGQEVSDALVELMFADEPPEQFNPADFIAGLGIALERAQTRLRETDLAHAAELADDGPLRDDRDAARAALVELILRLRKSVSAAYGDEACVRLGLSKALPRDNHALVQHARHLVGQLDAQILGQPSDELMTLDVEALRERLRQRTDTLDAGLSGVERERREAQITLEQREAASEAWTRTYIGVADAFVALATLAGFDEISERVKPTAKRRAGRPEPIDEAGFEGDEEFEEFEEFEDEESSEDAGEVAPEDAELDAVGE